MTLNRNQIMLLAAVGGVLAVVLLSLLLFRAKAPPAPSYAKLVVWGVVDENDELSGLFSDFKAAYKKTYGNAQIDIEYKRWNEDEYESVLVNKIAEGAGPDVFFIKNTWLPKHHAKIFPFPVEGFAPYVPNNPSFDPPVWKKPDFERVFVKTVAKDLTIGSQIYAVPLFVDNLGLYYNEEMYRAAGVPGSKPPLVWSELDAAIPALARAGDFGTSRAAIALGSVKNIRLAPSRSQSAPTPFDDGSDLFSLFLLQRGGAYCAEFCTQATFRKDAAAADALTDYASYATLGSPNATWSPAFVASLQERYVDDDVDAFALGRVATIAGYASLDKELRNKVGKKFAVKSASMPQVGPEAKRVTIASYWAAAVAKNTKARQPALELLSYMAARDTQLAYFKKTRRPPAREDLVAQLGREEPSTYAVFIRQAQFAETLQIYDEQALKRVIGDTIEDLLAGKLRRDDALRRIEETVTAMTKGREPPTKIEAPRGTLR